MVYLIESDQAVRDAIGCLLDATGFSFRSYGSGEEFFRDDRPADRSCLIVGDLSPTGLTGLQTVKRLRQEKNAVPAILLTTGIGSFDLIEVERLGVGIIYKPGTPRELIEWIRRAMGRQ